MPDEREGLSIIEHMAATFYAASYKDGRPIVAWSSEDRMRFINAMEAAVKSIPDHVGMKRGFFAASCKLDQTRDFILGEHDVAKRSILYGR